jgi:type 1 fimbriae regulatory protein FimB
MGSTPQGRSVEQPIAGDELGAIKRYFATREDNLLWLFVSERGQPMTRQAVNYIVRLAGDKAKLGRVWPHMLRHSCGCYLADQGTACAPCRTILAPRPQAYRALHPCRRASVRRFVEVSASACCKQQGTRAAL